MKIVTISGCAFCTVLKINSISSELDRALRGGNCGNLFSIANKVYLNKCENISV